MNIPILIGTRCRDLTRLGRHARRLVENARTVYSVTGCPCASVTLPSISFTLSVNVKMTLLIFWPLRISTGVSVTSRPSIVDRFQIPPAQVAVGANHVRTDRDAVDA